jgi:SPP1 gp7 family putative phage head morphogenesis protein
MRIDDSLAQMRIELAHPAKQAARLVKDAKHRGVLDGVAFAAAVLASVGLSDRKLTTSPNIMALDHFRDGTDITQRFIREGHDATSRMNAIIHDGLAHDHSDFQIATALAVVLDSIIQNTAFRIANTEPMRMFRQGTIGGYKENKEHVGYWIWESCLDEKTCSVCWELHGTRHPLDEEMISHSGCRCECIPGGDDLDIDYGDTGEQLFVNQSQSNQVAILGRGKQYLYASGIITLAAMVAKERTRYGTLHVPLSIREMEKRGIISHAQAIKAYHP